VLGALLMQCLDNGLVMLGTDPYVFPLVTSAVIFAAVLLDVIRARALERWTRRRIRAN
jgi:ribose transport system permease protein